jgi:RNA-directed DNA polymerase
MAKQLYESPAETERMMEEICEKENCREALRRVKANKGSPGVDAMSVDELPGYLAQHWPEIRNQLLSGTYRPQPVRRVEIPKPDGGMRKLGVPTVLDRWVQQAILQVLQRRWDASFSDHSYGFRPGRSAHQAVARAQQYIVEGYGWVVDLDLEKFFDQPSQCPPQEPTFLSKVSSFSLPALSFRSAASVPGLSGKRYNFVRVSRASAMVPLWMRS